jgi:hypothetical protein
MDYPECYQMLKNYTGPIGSVDKFGVSFCANINHVYIKHKHALFDQKAQVLVSALKYFITNNTTTTSVVMTY